MNGSADEVSYCFGVCLANFAVNAPQKSHFINGHVPALEQESA